MEQNSTDSSATRALVLAALKDSRRALTVAEIQATTGLKDAVVRHHLRSLRARGNAATVPGIRGGTDHAGRPPARWRAVTEPATATVGSLFAHIATYVAHASPDAVEQLEAASEQWGRHHAVQAHEDDSLLAELSGLGFDPLVTESTQQRRTISLHGCPFGDKVRTTGDQTICRLHAALIRGALAAAGREQLEHLHIDPRAERCSVSLVPTRQ